MFAIGVVRCYLAGKKTVQCNIDEPIIFVVEFTPRDTGKLMTTLDFSPVICPSEVDAL